MNINFSVMLHQLLFSLLFASNNKTLVNTNIRKLEKKSSDNLGKHGTSLGIRVIFPINNKRLAKKYHYFGHQHDQTAFRAIQLAVTVTAAPEHSLYAVFV